MMINRLDQYFTSWAAVNLKFFDSRNRQSTYVINFLKNLLDEKSSVGIGVFLILFLHILA